MKKETNAGIFIHSGRKPWPHEMRVAKVLAASNHYVEFLPESILHTADIKIDGVDFEIKSPESFNVNTFEHVLKNATKQSRNLIIDTYRLKKIKDVKVAMFLTNYCKRQKRIECLILITKNGKIIDIFGSF